MVKEVQPQKHILVPEYRVLSKEEVQKVLETLDVGKEKLPKIYGSDPSLKGMEVETGDMIEIKRNSPTAGRTRYYRVVVPEPSA